MICNHCPYVLNIKSVMQDLLNRASEFEVVAVSGNDLVTYPEDAPEKMVEFAKDFDFPYLFDSEQIFLKALGAQCAPEFYIFKSRNLFYHGSFDGSNPSCGDVTGFDLEDAMVNAISGTRPKIQHPSIGCSIKWR